MKYRKTLALLMAAVVSLGAAYPASAVTITEEPSAAAAEETTVSNRIVFARMNGESAVAKISAKQEAKMIFEICSDDAEEKVLLTATGNVKAGGTSSKVKFEAAIPENFVLRVRMVSADGKTVYAEYYNPYYTKEVQDLLKTDTVDEATRNRWIEESNAVLQYIPIAYDAEKTPIALSVDRDHSIECPDHLTIPDKVKYTYNVDNDHSQELTLPVTDVWNCAFADLTSLQTIELPDSIVSLQGAAFRSTVNLKQIILPDSLEKIGSSLFENNKYMNSLVIPSSVKNIEGVAFHHMNSLETFISLPSEAETVTVGTSILQLCPNLKTAKIYASWDSVPFGTFYCDYALETVILPKTVTSFEEGAFGQCKALKQLEIPASVKKIGNRAFIECLSLIGLDLPEGLEEIGDYAFEGCKSMQSIELPKSVTTLGENVFSGLNRNENGEFTLKEITILNQNLEAANLENAFSNFIGKYADDYTKPTLKGYKGSTTESFAKTYGFNFVALDGTEPQTTTAPVQTTTAPVTTTTAVTDVTVHTVKDPTSTRPGDISMDGLVDVADAVLMARYVVADVTANITDQGKKNGDVNMDGEVNDQDMNLILQYIAKRIEVLPYTGEKKTS